MTEFDNPPAMLVSCLRPDSRSSIAEIDYAMQLSKIAYATTSHVALSNHLPVEALQRTLETRTIAPPGSTTSTASCPDIEEVPILHTIGGGARGRPACRLAL